MIIEPTLNKKGKLVGIPILSSVEIDLIKSSPYIVKPYLRPMSSMTPEEYDSMRYEYTFYGDSYIHNSEMLICGEVVDWLNKHYFDYRGLIGKGLAIEAPEGMYNIEYD